jgi:hypothetical protein
MKSLEPQSDELLLSRAKLLENQTINIKDSIDVIGKYIVLKTGKIEGFGQTYAPLAFFKAGSPNLEKLKPILFNEKKEISKNVTKNITKDLSKEITKLLEKPINVNEALEEKEENVKEETAITIAEPTEEFATIAHQVSKVLHRDPIEIKLPAKTSEGKVIEAFAPINRMGFPYFMWYVYNKYRLAELPKDFDPDYCKKIKGSEESTIALQAYQKMIRDYLQKSSPYRGLLINHGLGSGKSCASIAAMESIFAPGNKPIFFIFWLSFLLVFWFRFSYSLWSCIYF